MAKQADMAIHSATASTDSASVGLIKYILGTHDKVAVRLHDYDTWPNTDGHIEILDDDRQPMGIIWAQVKRLPENHELKFACPTGLFEFAHQIGPILLFGVDLKEKKVYWNYYDEDIVAELPYGGKKTLTIEFDPGRSFSEQDAGYIEAWKKLVNDRKGRISGLRDTIRSQLLGMIDVSRQLLEKHRYTETVRYLTDLKNTQWDIADHPARFRILTNMASALQQCRKLEEAAQYFLDAYRFDPGAPKARSNRAVAYLLADDYKKALAEADELLETNPLNPQASAIKILAMSGLGRKYKKIKASIDAKMLETPEVSFALGSAALEAKLTKEARSLIENAAAHDDDPQIAFTLGTNLLEEVINNNPYAVREILDDVQKGQVRQALGWLQKAWNSIPDIEDHRIRSEWLYHQTIAYRLLSEDHDAERAIEELLTLVPDNDLYVKNAALIALDSGKLTVAEAHLKQQIGRGSQMPELRLILTEVLMAQEKYEEAEGVVTQFINERTGQDNFWINAQQDLFEIQLKQGHIDRASQLAMQLTSQDATKVLGLLFSARLARMKQDSEQAISFLEQVEAGLSADTERRTIIGLAEEAYASGHFEIAARVYERLVQPHVRDPFILKYLHSLYEAKQFQKAIDVAEGIRKKYGLHRQIAQFEWASYEKLQNLPAARRILVQFVKAHPDDEDAKLSVALVDVRLENNRELNKFLDEPRKLDKLDFPSRIQLANLYLLHGLTKQLLEVLYDTRKRFENNPDAHCAYISLVLGLDDTTSELLEPQTVQPNTVLLYDGGFFVIEADHEPQIKDNEIDIEEARRRGFIGKKVGDKIELTRNRLVGAKEVRITAIKSKYIHALHDSMQNYERRFPQRSDLMSFNIEDAGFAPLFLQIDHNHDHATQIENLYKDGKITIDLFAKLVNSDFIDVFYDLRSTPDLGVRVANGNPEDGQRALELLRNGGKRNIVADLTALITFYELGCKPSEVGLGKFVVAQRTHDLIAQQIAKERIFGKRVKMTLFKQNGRYIRQELTAEQQKQRANYLEDFAKWVKKHTTTGAIKQEQIDGLRQKFPDLEKLNNLIAPNQLDTILLANSGASILYCDDFFLRTLVATTFGIEGIWTQVLLMSLLEQGKIDKQVYENSIVKLANSNYHFVVISADTLMEAAKQAMWRPGDPFTRVLKTLTRPDTGMDSMVTVLTNFLYEFYKLPRLVDRGGIIQQIINEATRHHNREQFLTLLARAVHLRFILLPLQAKEIENNINLWRQMHTI